MSDVLIGLRFDLYVFKYSDDECFVYVRRESWLQEDVCCVLSVVCCLDKRIVANGVFVTLLSHLYVLSETDCRQIKWWSPSRKTTVLTAWCRICDKALVSIVLRRSQGDPWIHFCNG